MCRTSSLLLVLFLLACHKTPHETTATTATAATPEDPIAALIANHPDFQKPKLSRCPRVMSPSSDQEMWHNYPVALEIDTLHYGDSVRTGEDASAPIRMTLNAEGRAVYSGYTEDGEDWYILPIAERQFIRIKDRQPGENGKTNVTFQWQYKPRGKGNGGLDLGVIEGDAIVSGSGETATIERIFGLHDHLYDPHDAHCAGQVEYE